MQTNYHKYSSEQTSKGYYENTKYVAQAQSVEADMSELTDDIGLNPKNEVASALQDIASQAIEVFGKSSVLGKPHTETFDQSTINAFKGQNFHPVLNTKADRDQWMNALNEMMQTDPDWLRRYNDELGHKGGERITMQELSTNHILRRYTAQAYLHDIAEKEKAVYGARPVTYNEAPYNTPQPSYMKNNNEAQRAELHNEVSKKKSGGWLSRAASAVTDKVSKLRFW